MIFKKINGMIRLFRPDLSLAAGICVVTWQILTTGRLPALQTGVLGFLCGFALSAAALVLNDYFDYEVDRINAPLRPLPSGAVSRSEALLLTAAISLVGLIAAALLGLAALGVGILFWLIGILYNWRFKQTGLPGNLMVSASVAVTFILGAITVGLPWSRIAWTFGLMAFFFDLGEEIAGDAMDMEGDKIRSSKSLALLKGKPFALRLTAILWSLVIVLGFIPFALGWLGWIYLAVILCMVGLLAYCAVRLLRSSDAVSGRRAMRTAYLGATLAIVAFLIGQWIP